MKLLRDLAVSRKELQDWTDNLSWARDGSIYITTVPDLTVCQPVYNKIVSSSKELFYIKEHPLNLTNKFEYDLAQENTLLNSMPESYVKACVMSPADDLLAVLTNNANVSIYEDSALVAQLDQPDRSISERAYHSVAWNVGGSMLAVGNESNEVVVFREQKSSKVDFVHHTTIKLSERSSCWVTKLEWRCGMLIASTSDNSVHIVNEDWSCFQIKEPSRLHIFDLKEVGKNVLFTTVGLVYSYDVVEKSLMSLDLEGSDNFYIIPLPNRNAAVLLSSKSSCILCLDQGMRLETDTIVSPHVENRFRKWNNYLNELNNYETSLLIHGLSASNDGSSLALLYSVDRLSIRYRIVSEQQYRICFIPLGDFWDINNKSIGLAWYQNYQIYDKKLPPSFDAQTGPLMIDTGLKFKEYLAILMSNDTMNILRFSNFIRDEKANDLYMRAIYDYAVAHESEIVNELDKSCIQSIANFLELKSPVASRKYAMRAEFIEETFDCRMQVDPGVIKSEEGHIWKRCAGTFLPLLTSSVKVCPVSNFRIIDIKRDAYNEYGWLTRTILESFNNQSIYSGTRMV